ncbi:PAAR domain-containing protein [Klebsiella pneumoniae]|uniref:PAAR domain-containing protein n=1 Tax=Klebsiella pneumoniae TaxID=573 RepID=UPI000E2DFDF0|nr:PAAR domain-containing protein [Klebsiella pneumoniae]MCD8731326.1 PAAR domain-containing protein [Klebsiella pneumoniae]WLW90221.1 PAAR domain-containing protein [Klebsiella pneumoniae]SYJ58796.1 PAAR motif family protein [Klebsiella pneumoniae]
MLQIIRKGDKTTHGGSVLTASETMKFGGIGVARKGDKVSCPVSPWLMSHILSLAKMVKHLKVSPTIKVCANAFFQKNQPNLPFG